MMRPTFDYENWPFAPHAGYQASNNVYMTISLFVEKRRMENTKPLFSLGEDDAMDDDGTWYPSARLIYINSKGEHDAMRKMVGSFKQWSQLKELAWFRDCWENWHAEWLMIQGSDARLQLVAASKKEVSAARALFDDAKRHKQAGRPSKQKVKRDDSAAESEDSARVVGIMARRP